MKRLLLILVIGLFSISCGDPTWYGGSRYQAKNINRFAKKKNYRPNHGLPKWVDEEKRGSYKHPAVKK